jgi:amino-acid N-acetyltransferase
MKAKIVDQHSVENVLELLRINKLPFQDVELKDNFFISYSDDQDKLIGSGGLEFYAGYALLRSVAVEETLRGKSLGKEIVSDLLERAKAQGVEEIYLLTETARDFFIKRGFQDIGREQVPAAVKQSSEFTSVCPVSAACMVYRF